MNYRIVLLLSAIMILFGSSSLLAGDEQASVVGMSMARTFVASSRGLEAIGTNPANLTLPYKGRIIEYIHRTVMHDSVIVTKDSSGIESEQTISVTHDTLIAQRKTPPAVTFQLLPSFGLNLRTDFVNYDIYNNYFTGVDTGGPNKVSRHLSDDDKNSVLGLFPSGIAETHADIDIRLFGLTIHNDFLGDIGFTVTDRAAMNFDLPQDYVRFFFFGLDSAGSTYNLSGTNVRAWYLREYAFSYARRLAFVPIKDFSFGFSVKEIQGYAVVTTEKYNATFGNQVVRDDSGRISNYILNGNFDFRVLRAQSDNFNEKTSFTPFPTPAGTGIGIDLGVNGEVMRGVRAGLSVIDIGSINWTANTKQLIATTAIHMTNPTSSDQTDSLKTAFKGKDTLADAFSTPLPTCLRLGAAIQVDNLPFISWFPGQWLIACEYLQGFNDSPGNSKRARFSFGTEYRPVSFLPLRTGVSFGGIDRFNWAGGFGLDFGVLNWNFGTENIGLILTPHSYQQASFGMSMVWTI
jgi:hypothetical protein